MTRVFFRRLPDGTREKIFEGESVWCIDHPLFSTQRHLNCQDRIEIGYQEYHECSCTCHVRSC